MLRLLFVVYVVVEVAALWAVGSALGAGWAVLLLMAGTAAGVIAFGAQSRRLLAALAGVRKNGSRGTAASDPARSLADGSLSATGVFLLLVPGLVTSCLGLALLFPPTRALLRPVVLATGLRRFPLAGVAGAGARRVWSRHVVVDGQVVDEQSGTDGPRGASDGYGPLFPPAIEPRGGSR